MKFIRKLLFYFITDENNDIPNGVVLTDDGSFALTDNGSFTIVG